MRRADIAIIAFVTAVLLGGLGLIAWQSAGAAQSTLLPALERKALGVSRSIASLADEAVGYGIPVDEIVGAEAVLQSALDENREFAFALIEGTDGQLVAVAARSAFADPAARSTDAASSISAPILLGDVEVGRVVIGVPRQVAETLIRDLWIDVLVLLLVAVLIALELTAFAFALSASRRLTGLARRLAAVRAGDFRPHDAVGGTGALAEGIASVDEEVARVRQTHAALTRRAQETGDRESEIALAALDRRHGLTALRSDPPVTLVAVRAPVFLFFFAEEMTRPFLPTFIARQATPVFGLSIELVIALPIVVFMAIVALSQPWLNTLTERVGRGRGMHVGAVLAAFGYIGTAFAETYAGVVGFRALTAVGFAAVFVAAQGFIVDRTEAGLRARGIGIFVSAIMAAMLCGPPIGGILSDRLGDTTAFTICAVMALLAALTAIVALPSDRKGQADTATRSVRLSDFVALLRVPLMAALILGCALPAKMLLIGLCFYLLPLALASQFEPAAIGRVLMLYGLAMLVVVPLISRLSDGAGRRVPFVIAGGLLSATAVGHLWIWPEPWGAALTVLQIGVGQGLSTTPQSALVGEIGRRLAPHLSEGGIYGVFRLVERLGTALGPLFVAAVWTMYSQTAAVWSTALLVALGSAIFGLLWWWPNTRTVAERGAN
ncbi:MAG: MFS transporter [Pseudomonadota bacterium]